MIVIIDAKYEKSAYATINATEWYFVVVIR